MRQRHVRPAATLITDEARYNSAHNSIGMNDRINYAGHPLRRCVAFPKTLTGHTGPCGAGGNEEVRTSSEGQNAISASLQQVMERYYRSTQSTDEFDGLKRRCLARITATLAKLRERAAEFEGQLMAAQEDKVSYLCVSIYRSNNDFLDVGKLGFHSKISVL